MIRSLLFASCLTAPMMVSTVSWAQRTDSGLGDALTQPLRDLSILRPEPAEALQSAAAGPYADAATLPDGALDCASVASEIEALDAALGEDVDVVTPEASLMAQAQSDLGNAIVDAAGDLVELPYRGLIRRITGAERRDREMSEAVQAGMVRRAYLKGLSARECATPQLLAVYEPAPLIPAPPLSDLELARIQLAAANAAAVGASALPAPPAGGETAPDVAVTAAATEARFSELELARTQLAAANAAAANSQWSAPPVAGDTAPGVAVTAASAETQPSDLELARRQLAAANAAVSSQWPAPLSAGEAAPDVAVTAAATETPSDLELARRQLAAANAAVSSQWSAPLAGSETAPDVAVVQTVSGTPR